jgi:DNA-3-methyladenine glycosylase II
MPKVSFADASAELARRDRVMRRLVKAHGPCRIPRSGDDHFHALAESIVYQQLAGAAAAAIFGRFRGLFDGAMAPEAVLAAPETAMRGAGLSPNKLASIRDLSQKVLDGTLPLDRISRLRDEAIIERLVTVRGIGRWTAEMFLIFHLGRADVISTGDLGIRRAVQIAYGMDELPGPAELERIAEPWRPHRTLACLYLWRSLANTPG